MVAQKDGLSKSVVTKSSIETEDQGREFGKSLKPGALVFLSGELGAGKTCFTKGIALGLGINEDIKSPSFTIINEYVSGTLPLFHIDLYRLGGGDIFELGIDEYISRGGVTVIEWAERFEETGEDYFKDAVIVKLSYISENERGIEIG